MTGHELATGGWFEAAMQLSTGLPGRPGLSWRLQLVAQEGADVRRWHQVVDQGRVTAWGPGSIGDPDLEVRWPLEVARGVHRREVSGTAAMAALRVVSPSGVEGPAPPHDIALRSELDSLPMVKGATFTVQYAFKSGPFGEAWFWMSFVDGRVGDMAFERTDEPDVEVHLTYQSMNRVRTGAMTILEALEDGGRVEGELGPLMLLAGMEESPELHAAEAACGPAGGILAAVGELSATEEYQAVLRALAAETR